MSVERGLGSMAWVEKRGSKYRIRYRLADGTLTSEVGFTTRAEAAARANAVESEQRAGSFVDPRLAQTRVGEWVRQWTDAHDVSAGTWAKYDAHLRNHILPRFGELCLGEVNRMAVKAWVKQLRRSLAERTVGDVVALLSMILGEAVDEGLIGMNPCRRLRVNAGGDEERPHASAEQVRALTDRTSAADRVLIIAAAYTGMRWGELVGLQWSRVDLGEGVAVVDAKVGALHEVNGHLELGPPKTVAGARTIHLPEFLVELLDELRERHPGERFVFTASEGGWHRRANFRRRVWLPAVNGDRKSGREPIAPGLHFHDLRHTHKTWMIEDEVPEVLQHKRLGHKLAGVRGIYSHTTQPMVDKLLAGLHRRWEHSGSTGSTESR